MFTFLYFPLLKLDWVHILLTEASAMMPSMEWNCWLAYKSQWSAYCLLTTNRSNPGLHFVLPTYSLCTILWYRGSRRQDRTGQGMEKEMDAGQHSEVTCVDFWCNEFGMRVRIALRELAVPFEYIEEDLRVRERSDLVRRMNPIHRSIPILIHHGRPVCGSVNIVEYIDEVWGQETLRLLPADPADRADARFWADFIDHKVFSTQTRFFTSKGEEKEAVKEELVDHLKRLEEVLGDKCFFSGDEFGFLDAVFIPFSSMFYGYEQHGGIDLEVECPKLTRWEKRCRERESVSEVLPDGKVQYELHKKFYGIE